jgi:hypothetical protein
MSKESPVMGYTELESYQIALQLRKQLGLTPKKRMTAKKAVTKVHMHFESDIVKIARLYHHTFAVEPYGQTTRIYLRNGLCQMNSSTKPSQMVTTQEQ